MFGREFALMPGLSTSVYGVSPRLSTRTVHRWIRARADRMTLGVVAERARPIARGVTPSGLSRRRGKGVVHVTDDLVAPAIEASGGHNLWNTLRAPTVNMSVGPAGRMTFDAATDTVALPILDGAAVGTLAPARAHSTATCDHRPGTPNTWGISWAMRTENPYQ
jgi:hypothetical protein